MSVAEQYPGREGRQVIDVVDTIRRRMARADEIAAITTETATSSEVRPATNSASSLSHARFSALTARLAQVAARAAADSLAEPACAHDPVQEECILRFLSDVRRIAETIADIAAGHCPVGDLQRPQGRLEYEHR